MRKWRAENRDKNKRNDLRCRVYRLARQKFGEGDSQEKQQFINEEIARRLGKRMLLEQKQRENSSPVEDDSSRFHIQVKEEFLNSNRSPLITPPQPETLNELPFYCAPLHKIELPSINMNNRRPSQSTEPSGYINKSQPPSPMSDNARHEDNDAKRKLSGCSMNSSCSSSRSPNMNSNNTHFVSTNPTTNNLSNNKMTSIPTITKPYEMLPPMLAYVPLPPPLRRGVQQTENN